MSRHRNVRSLNYEDEYDGYDDVYGHSVEDDYCISPSTAAQFMYNRDAISSLSSYMREQEIPEEEEGDLSDQDVSDTMQDSGHFQQPILSEEDQGRLNSCLEEIRNVIGDSTAEHLLIDAVIKHKFNYEAALDSVLCQKEQPKPQREQRQRKTRSEDDSVSQNHLETKQSRSIQISQSDVEKRMSDVEKRMPTPPDRGMTSSNEKMMKNISSLSALIKEKERLAKSTSSPFTSCQDNKLTGHSANQQDRSNLPPPTLSILANHNERLPALSSLTNQKKESHIPPPSLLSLANKNDQSNLPPPSLSSLANQITSNLSKPSLSSLASQHNPTNKLLSSLSSFANQRDNMNLPSSTNLSPSIMSLSDLAHEHQIRDQTSPSLSQLANQNRNLCSMSLSSLSRQHDRPIQLSSASSNLSGQHGMPVSTVSSAVNQPQAKQSFSSLTKSDSRQDQMLITLSNLADQNDKSDKQSTASVSSTGKYGRPNKSHPALTSSSSNESETSMYTKFIDLTPDGASCHDRVSDSVTSDLASASLFAEALCSNLGGIPGKSEVRRARRSRFLYRNQVSTAIHSHSYEGRVVAFDFQTPSPDDIVKNKQRSAFTRDGKGAATAETNQHDTTHTDLHDRDSSQTVLNHVSGVTNDVTRMTFKLSEDNASAAQDNNCQSSKGHRESRSGGDVKPAAVHNVSSEHMLGAVSATATGGATAAASPSDTLVSTPKKESQNSAAKRRQEALKIYEKRKAEGKDLINLVVIGHVDAGKSTLMGHLLFQLGSVNKKTMHKYEQESKKLGKASFAYAWVLDETEEERSRGVTMDIAQTRFETENKSITLLDAPGHKDFIPNMITGAAQADVAILVVNATRGEFETGFEMGGQTREHAMLIRSLGVSQLLVALNKMDTVDWSSDRYNAVLKKLSHFLKQTGFKEADVAYVPCSGLSGENLTKPATEKALTSWYTGPTLLQQIDKFKSPERDIDKTLRLCVSDVYKGMGAGFSVAGTLQAGYIQPGDKVIVMPHGETANVKGVGIDDIPVQHAFAGDTVTLTLTGMDIANVNVGSIICDNNYPIRTTTRFRARVVIFGIDLPITKGFPIVLHYQSISEPAHIRKLISQLHKGTGEVVKKKPRCLVKNTSAIVEIEVGRPICLELYKDFKDLGRFMLRYGGITIAAGLVTEILDERATKE